MESTIWIQTEPSLDGSTYTVTLSLSEDYAVVLTPARARAYAEALLGAAGEAEYDHAILGQLTSGMDMPLEVAAQLVSDIREGRKPRIAAGLEFVPGVGMSSEEAFVEIQRMEGASLLQLSVPASRRHALQVLEAVPAADLDARYYKVLRSTAGVDEQVARKVVGDLQEWREEWSVANG